MLGKIKAFVVNRNLVTTLNNTIEFLKKEPRIEIVVFDQDSTYPPLLEYYEKNAEHFNVIYSKNNNGPHSVWSLKDHFNDNYFIVTDSDCIYDDVPNDWLNKMINVLTVTSVFKVGFSLDIDDLPNTNLGLEARNWELKYWTNKTELGWDAHIDTTFALYRPHSGFSYDALRLDKPYCIKHFSWYLTKETITDEWLYYIKTASGISTWSSKIINEIEK